MKYRRNKRNRSSGFALIAIITIGLVALAMAMALFPLALTIARNESSGRYTSELRTASEIGIDYAIRRLNDTAVNNPGQAVPSLLTQSVPPEYLQGFEGGTVTTRIKQLTPDDWNAVGKYSTLYSVYLDPNFVAPTNPAMSAQKYVSPFTTRVQSDYWRVLESTAKRGPFSRSVRVILEPRFDILAGETGGTGPSTSYFKNAFFTKSGMNISANNGPLSFLSLSETVQDGAYPLTVRSNQEVKLTGGVSVSQQVQVQGNVAVTNGVDGAPTPSMTTGVANGSNFVIDGRLTTNTAPALTYKASPGPLPTVLPTPDNVLANADLQSGGPARSDASGNPNLSQPANISSNSDFIIPAPTPNGVNTSTLPSNLNSSVLPSGEYSAPSLQFSSSGNSAIINANSPVQMYIQDKGAFFQNPAADIQASALNNKGATSNLQIWYSGTRAININLDANFNGTIYAPNAPVSFTGTKDFKGAIVGDKLNINSTGNFYIDTALQNLTANSAPTGGLAYSSNGIGNSPEPILHGYKAVTWQEIHGSIVP